MKKILDSSKIHSVEEIEAANMVIVAEKILLAAESRPVTLGSHIMYRKEDE